MRTGPSAPSRGDGVVRQWDADAGWGVVVLDRVGLLVWTHYSAVVAEPGTYRSLEPGRRVRCWFETPGQDGYAARALRVEAQD
ncbi:cold-shock protein [Dactylosporangium sp. CA-052675]|uniref:cold-shock protein n=1 Tax=Dactylosporangium sp. CA-052675 TaxID=3239927 RepID=UPI003D8CC891